MLLAGLPPCTRRPLLKKGSIRKLFLWTGDIFLTERQRIRDAGTVDFREPIYGHRSLSPLWVFCAFVHGGRHPPKAFGFSADASHHARPEKALPFQAGRSARNTNRQSGFAFTPRRSFWGFHGAFFQKRALGRVWDSVPHKKGRGSSSACLFYRFFSVNRQLSLHISKRPLSAVQPKSFLAFSALA